MYLQKQQSNTWGTVALTLTNAQGYFEFRDVPAGRYRVILDVPGLEHDNPQIVEITDRDTIRNIEYVITEDDIINNTVNITTFTQADRNIRVYPNPTSSLLIIDFGEFTIDNEGYSVYNVTGQMLMQGKLSRNSINVALLPSGMYYLRIKGQTVKFIKE